MEHSLILFLITRNKTICLKSKRLLQDWWWKHRLKKNFLTCFEIKLKNKTREKGCNPQWTSTCSRGSNKTVNHCSASTSCIKKNLPFGIVHGTPNLHLFLVSLGTWAFWLVSSVPVEVEGSCGGVWGAVDVWGVVGGVSVREEVLTSWVWWSITGTTGTTVFLDCFFASAISSLVLSLPGHAHMRIFWAFLPTTVLLLMKIKGKLLNIYMYMFHEQN